MDKDQQDVYSHIETYLKAGKLFTVVVVGPGGTGKIFLLSKVCELLTEHRKEHRVCAPTGGAAILVNGSTVHRLFKVCHNEVKARYVDFRGVDCIVCDEAFMLSSNMFNQIRKKMNMDCVGRSDFNPDFPSRQLVFHGFVPRTSTVFFGDPLQLEPIDSKGVWCTSTVEENFHMWDLKYVKYKVLFEHQPQEQRGRAHFSHVANEKRGSPH